MCTRKFSLLIAGIIWILVGIRIGSRAAGWLEPYFQEPNWMLSLIVVSVLIAFIKSKTVLRKAVERNINNNLDKIDDKPINYLIGWLRLFGSKGITIISLMIGLGFLLRWLKSIGYDPYNIFGFIYLGISLALIFASRYYFGSIKNANK